MAIRKHEMARITANALLEKGRSRDEIVSELETEFGEDVTVLQKIDHDEIWFVFDDNTPNVHLLNISTVRK